MTQGTSGFLSSSESLPFNASEQRPERSGLLWRLHLDLDWRISRRHPDQAVGREHVSQVFAVVLLTC